VKTVEICRAHDAPVLGRGGGTSLAGQCSNVAVVIDFSKYVHRILEIDPERRIARVQPGVILDRLRAEARRHGLTFGPDPATHAWCTLGGMIGNNSCGVHSVTAGRTADNVEELEILTYDGLRLRVGRTSEEELAGILAAGGRRAEIYGGLRDLRDRTADLVRARFPRIPRRVSGYNLDELLPEREFNVARALVGTEGTCATVLEATVRLVDHPPARVLLVLGYPDVFAAADGVVQVREAGPIGLEGFDDDLVAKTRTKKIFPKELELPDGGGWLLVEFGGATEQEAEEQARALMGRLGRGSGAPAMRLFTDEAEASMVWRVRESGLGATAQVPGEPDAWEGWEDSAVPPERLGQYLRDLRKLFSAYGYEGAIYGHFGDGCIHTRITFDLLSEDGVRKFRSFVEEAADLVVSYGGSLSGEHGDGQSRAELLPKMFGNELVDAFRRFKGIWDPAGRMNPGKVVDPEPITSSLRLGAAYHPARPGTHFAFPDDDGSLARAVNRCVGVGKCRRDDSGIMCPSYMVTRDEMHSTRGRARLLHEMLRGDSPVDGRWRDERVKEALDLCLSCKGCKVECPVNVDMATYKAEFLSHYYKGRRRPAPAYAMGLIFRWARIGARLPGLANKVAGSRLLKRLAGIHPQRRAPRLAARPFARTFRPRPRRERPSVLLWPDTFNDHFEPEILRSAVEVLEDAGFDVRLPPRGLCCGRPLYDFGMLDLAKRQLRRILRALRDDIRAGTPIVGLEPSCVAVFRDELVNLFPRDEDARRLSRQVVMLSEFLARAGYEPPTLPRKAIVQRHCHHAAVMGFDAEEALMRRMGLSVEILDSGCCGMAGAFGFEKEKYEVSIRAAERVLLPAVRRASADDLVVADGFSCREQVAQGAARRPLHLAEVLRMALREGSQAKPE
jgi:FAD/FMN-containing dehydrogenase/Fe-S oxidoreductase